MNNMIKTQILNPLSQQNLTKRLNHLIQANLQILIKRTKHKNLMIKLHQKRMTPISPNPSKMVQTQIQKA